MSAPDYLYINYAENGLIKHHLPNRVSVPLFEYMLTGMAVVAPDYVDQFEGEFYGDVLSICGATPNDYAAIVALIMQACDEVAVLQPFKADLKSALEADPRFKKAAA
jgi:hypothetical protein